MQNSYKERREIYIVKMFIYTSQMNNQNPFGFDDDKSIKRADSSSIRSRATKRAASSKSSTKKKKRLSKKNIEFLKSLGFEVKVR